MSGSAIRLSVIDLMQIPTGAGPIPLKLPHNDRDGLREGAVVQSRDGKQYQLDRGRLREIVTVYTCELWGLTVDASAPSDLLKKYEEGLLILPPPYLSSEDL
ncbi:hypothetical protein D3C77_250770 [compost metagenome]